MIFNSYFYSVLICTVRPAYTCSYDFAQYEPYIVSDKNNKNLLYCKVTSTMISKLPEKVENHVQGRKYIRYKTLQQYNSVTYYYILYVNM